MGRDDGLGDAERIDASPDRFNGLRDRVLTTGGIYGSVVSVHDDLIQLRVADSVKVQVAKSAVTQLVEEPSKRS